MKYLLTSLALVLTCTALPAQTDETSEPVDVLAIDYSDFPQISSANDTAFQLLGTTDLTEDFYIRHDGKYCRLQPSYSSLSREHFYSGPSPMAIYRKGVDQEGKTIFVPVAECKLPSGSPQLILCLAEVHGKLRAAVIDMSLRAQPLGSIRFVNVTSKTLIVMLNDQRKVIQPGEEVISKIATDDLTFFNFKIAARLEGEPQLVFTNRYPFRGAMRMLFIGYNADEDEMGLPFNMVTQRDRGPAKRVFIPQKSEL